jgi:hypothetical protein
MFSNPRSKEEVIQLLEEKISGNRSGLMGHYRLKTIWITLFQYYQKGSSDTPENRKFIEPRPVWH